MPWWRVVRADGSLTRGHEREARAHYLAEGTPLRPSGAGDVSRAFWVPPGDEERVELPGRAGVLGGRNAAPTGPVGTG